MKRMRTKNVDLRIGFKGWLLCKHSCGVGYGAHSMCDAGILSMQTGVTLAMFDLERRIVSEFINRT